MTTDDMIATLRAQGYRVTKPRPKVTIEPPTVGCYACGSTDGTRLVTVGPRKARKRQHAVRICDSCYRFGTGASTLTVPRDLARYRRVYRAWRRAQRRYHATIQHGTKYGADVYSAHPRLVALAKTLQALGGQVAA